MRWRFASLPFGVVSFIVALHEQHNTLGIFHSARPQGPPFAPADDRGHDGAESGTEYGLLSRICGLILLRRPNSVPDSAPSCPRSSAGAKGGPCGRAEWNIPRLLCCSWRATINETTPKGRLANLHLMPKPAT